MGSFADALVVALFVLLLTLLVPVWAVWKSPGAFWSGALGEPVASSAWLGYLSRERDELLTALALRDEAYSALDGKGLEVADVLAQLALERLGGLAGSW
ncbi:hypothetical protein RSP673_013370 [Ralstonia solanacearum P673]|uniref:hypothetical protein n=1 Tax=Ralstonia solanacearum TaxID=305 RepID=UPI00202A5E33|nr:hypothetical protein [Ralstonia solanacearum]MCL9850279.1 hypothetical protein [Ralstonia solanacearum]MCL9857449.1 hypothetical protein [Ralstonia solanacearum]MCL9864891.1 hypothetical protein [Ralstonia solanacearum]MCL9869283.1 hypothetical protein [Ralstonia solanacearum]MCL9874147.1 hypothetical protein [Ralstonia solanacearum]